MSDLQHSLARVEADRQRDHEEQAKKVAELSQQLAQTQKAEEKDSHKLTAMHKVVEGKDAELKHIEQVKARFDKDLAESAAHAKDLEQKASASKTELDDVTKRLNESQEQVHHLEDEKKKTEESHKAQIHQSLVQVESTAQAKAQLAAKISNLEKSLTEQKAQTAEKEKRVFDDEAAIKALKTDIDSEKKTLQVKEKVEQELKSSLKADEGKLSALEKKTKEQADAIAKD